MHDDDGTLFAPQTLDVELEHGHAWTLLCWGAPDTPDQLASLARARVEATLLSGLTQPPRVMHERGRRYLELTLLCFASAPGLEAALAPMGWERSLYIPDHHEARMAVAQRAAHNEGRTLPDQPASVWRMPIHHPEGEHGDLLRRAQATMAARMGDDLLGATPGGPSRLLANLLKARARLHITPDWAGLDALETTITQRDVSGVRWIPPLLFQALCDFVGIVLHSELGVGVECAICDERAPGLYAPPMMRIRPAVGRPQTLRVGIELVRRCVMPVTGDDATAEPVIGAWLRERFTA